MVLSSVSICRILCCKRKRVLRWSGLDVEIKERDLKYNNIDLIKGNAQYGIADSILDFI